MEWTVSSKKSLPGTAANPYWSRGINHSVGQFRYARPTRGGYTVLEQMARDRRETKVRVPPPTGLGDSLKRAVYRSRVPNNPSRCDFDTPLSIESARNDSSPFGFMSSSFRTGRAAPPGRRVPLFHCHQDRHPHRPRSSFRNSPAEPPGPRGRSCRRRSGRHCMCH